MGILDGVLGGLVGGGLTHLVTGVIEQHGGLAGLVNQFNKQGLDGIMKSWVGTGSNLPISAEQVQQGLGADTLTQLAAKFGMNTQDLTKQLANLLPHAVDQMTPGGVIPKS